MAMLTCKASVRFKDITPALMRILCVVYQKAQECEAVRDVVITSVNDSTHAVNSRHYTNEAIDLRTKNFPTEAAKLAFAREVRTELGPAFTVLYESAGTPNEHLHIQAKKGTVYTG